MRTARERLVSWAGRQQAFNFELVANNKLHGSNPKRGTGSSKTACSLVLVKLLLDLYLHVDSMSLKNQALKKIRCHPKIQDLMKKATLCESPVSIKLRCTNHCSTYLPVFTARCVCMINALLLNVTGWNSAPDGLALLTMHQSFNRRAPFPAPLQSNMYHLTVLSIAQKCWLVWSRGQW